MWGGAVLTGADYHEKEGDDTSFVDANATTTKLDGWQ